MEKRLNDADLSACNVDEQYFLFYQVWKELTNTHTMDSYQYRMMNLLSLIKEFISVIDGFLSKSIRHDVHIKNCREELLYLAKSDIVMKEKFPRIQKTLLNIIGNTKTDSESALKALKYKLSYLFNDLCPTYFTELFNTVEENIKNADADLIIKNTDTLISFCVFAGWSVQALNKKIAVLNGSKEDAQKWKSFRYRLCNSQKNQYFIYIPVMDVGYKDSSVPLGEELKKLGFTIKLGSEIQSICHSKKNVGNQFIEITAKALDFYSAAEQALRIYGNLYDSLSFYKYISPWNRGDLVLYVYCDKFQNEQIKAIDSKTLYKTYDYQENAKTFLSVSSKVAREFSHFSLASRLSVAYSYANMGKISNVLEEKFLSTWVALESLCKTDINNCIIDNIVSVVPHALCNRYVYWHYRNFMDDCVRCGVDFVFSTGSFDIKKMRNEEKVRKLIEIIWDDVFKAELEVKCSCNQLLAERFKYICKLSNDGKFLKEEIKSFNQNVTWHIYRLYRIRNNLAHSGFNERDVLLRCTEHLNDYLSKFVSEIIMCWSKGTKNDITQILELLKDNYATFMSEDNLEIGNILKFVHKSGIIPFLTKALE